MVVVEMQPHLPSVYDLQQDHSLHVQSMLQFIQDLKNIKNVKRCRDGMPKSMQTRVGIMHESKGQHIGKAPSLHLFHTAVGQCMGVFLKRTTSTPQPFMTVASFSGHFLAPPTWTGNEATNSPTFLL